jgi:hypothetical protein
LQTVLVGDRRQIGDQILTVIGFVQTGKAHRCARCVAARVLKEIVQVLGRPDIGDFAQSAGIVEALCCANGTTNHVVKVWTSGVLAGFKLVTGAAFAEDLFALCCIGGLEHRVEIHRRHGFFSTTFCFAGVDHVNRNLFAMRSADMVQGVCRPFAKKENQKCATKAADDLREGHCIEHDVRTRR